MCTTSQLHNVATSVQGPYLHHILPSPSGIHSITRLYRELSPTFAPPDHPVPQRQYLCRVVDATPRSADSVCLPCISKDSLLGSSTSSAEGLKRDSETRLSDWHPRVALDEAQSENRRRAPGPGLHNSPLLASALNQRARARQTTWRRS